jgi:exopolysaccharide production protein ExoZ
LDCTEDSSTAIPGSHRGTATEVVSIQYLRGIAAMMVVFAHANEPFASPTHQMLRNLGFSGVDLFFVISGFVMTYIVAARPTPPGGFLLRRIARIGPLYWVMTAVTAVLVVSVPHLLPHSRFTWLELIASLLFIPFPNPGANKIAPLLKIGWTLNYEMFFYVCFALLLFLTPWRRTLALCCVFAFLILAGAMVGSDWAPLTLYGNPVTIEFLMGCIVGCVCLDKALRRITMPAACVLIAFATICLIAGSTGGDLDHREIDRGLPAAIIVMGALALEQHRLPTSRWLLALGDATYSIYLTHLFIVMGLYQFVRHVPFDGAISYLFPSVTMVICGIAGIVIYNAIESPLVRTAKRIILLRNIDLAA